jgi:uracil-DNA glycosylase
MKPSQVKVVIIGQDPYIREGQATGYAFSVPDEHNLPPSLRNIYKELAAEGYRGYEGRKTGNLAPWIRKGVLLLNTCLTVNAGESKSHKNVWRDFTNIVINYLNNQGNIAWILLGNEALKYSGNIDSDCNGVYYAGHPSPMNRTGSFLGSCIFEEAEEYLNRNGIDFTWHLQDVDGSTSR